MSSNSESQVFTALGLSGLFSLRCSAFGKKIRFEKSSEYHTIPLSDSSFIACLSLCVGRRNVSPMAPIPST